MAGCLNDICKYTSCFWNFWQSITKINLRYNSKNIGNSIVIWFILRLPFCGVVVHRLENHSTQLGPPNCTDGKSGDQRTQEYYRSLLVVCKFRPRFSELHAISSNWDVSHCDDLDNLKLKVDHDWRWLTLILHTIIIENLRLNVQVTWEILCLNLHLQVLSSSPESCITKSKSADLIRTWSLLEFPGKAVKFRHWPSASCVWTWCVCYTKRQVEVNTSRYKASFGLTINGWSTKGDFSVAIAS